MRILVADDDRLVRNLLNRVLKSWGHTVQLAEDGLAAWNYIQEHRVDCVISDWLMPNMNGVELLHKIRDLDSRAYVYTILLTSKNENADLVTAFEAGADDFVGKPVDFDVLRARIRAGERIVHLEQDLAARNKKLEETNRKLEDARLEIQRLGQASPLRAAPGNRLRVQPRLRKDDAFGAFAFELQRRQLRQPLEPDRLDTRKRHFLAAQQREQPIVHLDARLVGSTDDFAGMGQ